jgi:hypothetical protein
MAAALRQIEETRPHLTMFDTVQPRSFEQLVEHGFNDVPG